MKKCIYCKTEVDENSVVDVCDRCGVGVWGHKMFQAIKDGMENARDNGNLNQGSVTSTSHSPKRSSSFAQDAVSNPESMASQSELRNLSKGSG